MSEKIRYIVTVTAPEWVGSTQYATKTYTFMDKDEAVIFMNSDIEVKCVEETIKFMEDRLKRPQYDYDIPNKIEGYACYDCHCWNGDHSDDCIVTHHREKLAELKAFKEGVNKIEHKVDPETDQFHAPSWIIELAYLAQEGIAE